MKEIVLTIVIAAAFVWYVKEVLIPTWNEKNLKKEESERASIKATVIAMHHSPKSSEESVWLNDSGVHGSWGEGAESFDEL